MKVSFHISAPTDKNGRIYLEKSYCPKHDHWDFAGWPQCPGCRNERNKQEEHNVVFSTFQYWHAKIRQKSSAPKPAGQAYTKWRLILLPPPEIPLKKAVYSGLLLKLQVDSEDFRKFDHEKLVRFSKSRHNNFAWSSPKFSP